MKMVPINVENIDFIRLDLSRHYIQIDCDFVCYIVLNPSGTIPVGGTDVCAFHVGAWQVDAWKFLTKDFAQIPGFSACLVWDRTLVTELSKAPQVAESDIDTANSISSLKGQPVNITGFSLAEGETLKVSTLDNEFCKVMPFSSFGKDSLFASRRLCHRLKVNSEFDSTLFPSDCVISSDDGYKVSFPVMSFLGKDSAGTYSGSVFNGKLDYHVYSSGTAGNNYSGGLSDWYVKVSLSDNIITSLDFYITGLYIRNDMYPFLMEDQKLNSCNEVFVLF